jgi:hypothetical protein
VKGSRILRRARLCLLLSWLASAAGDRAFGADVVTPERCGQGEGDVRGAPGARQYYDGYWFSPPIIADTLASWQPHKPPWQFCHNESRHAAGQAGARQARRGHEFDQRYQPQAYAVALAEGCDVIISFPGSATGLCSAIEEAADKGILFTAIG